MSNCRMSFELLATDGKARRGRLTFPRGVVETPAFMPVGTYGTVKGMLPRDIVDTGAQMILGNTFHLWLRPGTEVIKKHGDLRGCAASSLRLARAFAALERAKTSPERNAD